ncbi:hypothetical protein [Aquimonas sp.]|jgi:hypothetical protein|uniref:hypothetical protein n=1 Tax=Aquimonas sp. TaxID=1872588 RepID=UPI0037BE7B16
MHSSLPPPTPADDGFERHYTEKLWALIPELHRNEDGLAARPDQLRALVEVLARQAAVARRSIDRLSADTRADEADDWAIPYLGALLGARPVHARNRAGQRANLGRTLLYRRRQGTLRLAELLADDIADFDAVAAEAFKRLPRYWHLLDAGPLPGPITASPQWGYVDLRSVRVAELLDGPHDEFSHFPDMRQHRGQLGRYGVARLNLHLFRQYAFALRGVTPVQIAPQLYTLDPSGRDVPMFQIGGRVNADCHPACEWQMRAPLSCHRLNAAGFRPLRAHAPAGLATALAPIYGRRFAHESGLLEAANAALAPAVLSDAQAAALIGAAMETATPRFNLLPGGDASAMSVSLAVGADLDATPLGPTELYGANLAEWGLDHAVPGWVRGVVDPRRGRVRLMAPPPADLDLQVQGIYYGCFMPVGAGGHARGGSYPGAGFTALSVDQPDFTQPLSGELRFMDSRTVRPLLPANGILRVDGDLLLRAAERQRPYVVLAAAAGQTIRLRAIAPDLELVIDGLWLGVLGAAAGDCVLRIEGSWRRVVLRDLNIDPGGERAAAPGQPAEVIPAVTLEFGDPIAEIEISSAMTGRIVEAPDAVDACATDCVRMREVIVRGNGPQPAILLRNARLQIDDSTVFGDITVGRIDASQLLVDGRVRVEDRQAGCFRFSAAAGGGRVPHPYRSHFFSPSLPAGTFVSRRFGDPGYAQLSEQAAGSLRTGGDGGSEIGVFNRALDPIKRADLRNKLDEFMPINAIAQLVIET